MSDDQHLKDGEIDVVLDIRSSSIGVALVKVHELDNPEIIYSYRKYIEFNKRQDGDTFISSMLSLLGEILENLSTEGMKVLSEKFPKSKVRKGRVFYSSPWYSSNIKNVAIKKQKPFVFKKDDLEEFINKEIKEVPFKRQTTMIEKDITHVVINGYEVDNPFNKRAVALSVSLYISEMADETLKLIKSALSEKLPEIQFSHRTHSLALFTTIRNTFPHTPTYMFMDIGGEITDIGIIEHNSLVHSISIPLGRNYVLREVAEETKMKISEVSNTLENLFTDEFMNPKAKKVRNALEKVKTTWVNKIKESLEGAKVEIPKNIFLNSDSDIRDVFKSFMEDDRLYIKEENTTALNNIITLKNDTFNHLVNYLPGCKKDPFIEIESIFLHNSKITI